MTRVGLRAALAVYIVQAVAVCPAWASLTKPWDALVTDPNASWIDPNSVNMYAANTAASYPVRFATAKSGGGARGMNSIRFVDTTDAHHATSALTGSVDVLATGKVPFSDLLVLVAIDSPFLPGNFALTMNGYTCDPLEDFVDYDGTDYAAGRPSGYYPAGTDPAYEPIAYDFEAGMVTVLAFTGVTLDTSHPVTLNYSFENLPGKAVFSAYAWPTGGTEIYHTNRGLYDVNDSTSTVSTFEVVPEPGDANGDGVVNAFDYMVLKQHIGAGSGAGVPEGDFDNDGDVDWADLHIMTGGFGAGSSATGAIPEPASLAILACGLITLLRRKRR